MNRLVIIGNGFDLAHGLPTSYRHFIEDYWRNFTSVGYNFLINNYTEHEDDLIKTSVNLSGFDYYRRQDLLKEYNNITSYADFIKFVSDYDCDQETTNKVNFKNSFFGKINELHSAQNWVDIENEYYYQLKKIVKSSDGERIKKENIEKLNHEFEDVKNLLEKYLIEKINVKSVFDLTSSNVNEILSLFKIQFKYLDTSLNVQDIDSIAYTKEFNNADLEELISFDFKIIEASKNDRLYKDLKSGAIEQNNLFLNFNYTNTINNYVKLLNNGDYCGKVEEIQIHGKLRDDKNKINFGFGDEMDDDYKIIENINDKEYLRNFKSFQYLQNSNYRKLLDFIDDNKFQVFIMGHSCGLSDRTLLNTIFEHENCRSIKIFYYEEKNVNEEIIRDNFTEIIQNISRHFNDKILMRSKIVNKTSCQPLTQLPKKQ